MGMREGGDLSKICPVGILLCFSVSSLGCLSVCLREIELEIQRRKEEQEEEGEEEEEGQKQRNTRLVEPAIGNRFVFVIIALPLSAFFLFFLFFSFSLSLFSFFPFFK